MSAIQHSAIRTVLQMMQARQMFIGDELRVSSLRAAWIESGQSAQEFGRAISELQRLGLTRNVHGTAGPSLQLTQAGFRAFTSQAPATSKLPQRRPAKPPTARARQAPTPTPGLSARRDMASRPLPPPSPQEMPRAQKPGPSRAAATIKSIPETPDAPVSQTRPDLSHAQVFRTRVPGMNDNVLRHCLLGLLKQYRLRPGGKVSYRHIMLDWEKMGLNRADLICALDLLLRDEAIRTTTQPEEIVQLTTRGYQRCMNQAGNLEDGMDRWQATKRLRKTKQLGNMPAA